MCIFAAVPLLGFTERQVGILVTAGLAASLALERSILSFRHNRGSGVAVEAERLRLRCWLRSGEDRLLVALGDRLLPHALLLTALS